MVAEDEIFDFWNILSNEIIGDVWLTVLILAAAIMFLAIKFKMPFEVQILFTLMILAAIFSQTLLIIIWVFIVMIVAILFYWSYSKVFS